MKFTQRKIIVLAAFLVIAVCSIVWAGNSSQMVNDYGGRAIQVFAPAEIVSVTTGNVTVSGYRVVMFDADETIYLNTDSSHTYSLPANTPLGIGVGVTVINVSGSAHMMVM